MPIPRRLILHAGTHKTGTTSLQVSLGARAHALRTVGILVPYAGRGIQNPAVGAHHTIAHQFLVNENEPHHRFSDLLAELAASQADIAVVSSENFECLHRSVRSLGEIARGLASIGYEPTVIFYVRDQAAYAESLYAELFEHGSCLRFEPFLATVLRDGSFTHNAHWHYAFDYLELVRPFEDVFGAEHVIVRAYPQTGSAFLLEEDFWSTLGVPRAIASDRSEMAVRLHPRMTFREALDKLYTNAHDKPADALDPATFLSRIGLIHRSFVDEPFEALENRDVARLSERFAFSNSVLERRCRAKITQNLDRPMLSPQRMILEILANHWNLA